MVGLFVSVPVASFHAPYAREYLQTLDVPPPSTVYGMLLSLVGETDRGAHIGAEIALAQLAAPEHSTVLRTVWRIKDANKPLGLGENRRPDFQELLTGVTLAVFLREGKSEIARPSLCDRVEAGLTTPALLTRFGGLALGESTHLVDEIRLLGEGDVGSCRQLIRDESGDLSLPVWVDHVGSGGTRWERFSIRPAAPQHDLPPEEAWTEIGP